MVVPVFMLVALVTAFNGNKIMKAIIFRAGLMFTLLAMGNTHSYAAPLHDAQVIQVDQRIGHISAWGKSLSDMTAQLAEKAESAGASHYVITSARVGNRTYGTAVIYR